MDGVVIAVIAIFLAGVIAGIIGVSTLASRLEDRQLLRNRPRGAIARSGRFVTGLKVDVPDPDAENWDQPSFWPSPPAVYPPGRRRRTRTR